MKEEKSANTILWAIAGLGAGIAIGLLVAPEKGEAIRAKIKEGARQKLDEVLETVEESLENAWRKAKEEEAASGNN